MEQINWLSLIIATLIPTVVGMIYYHPKAFGTVWMKSIGLSEEDFKKQNRVVLFSGVLLILYQTDLLDFSMSDMISYGFVLIGVVFFIKCINRSDRRGILGAVFFTLFGIAMILMREYTLPRDDEFGFAAFFVALAAGNFAFLPFKKDKSTNLI